MDPIAFLVGPYSIYWSTVIQAMAALTGVLLVWFFYLWDERDCVGAFCVVPLAIGGAVVLGRLAHWYFRQDSYLSLVSALTDYSYGGFALMGCFAGVFLAAAVLALLRWGRHFGAMLDALSVAGAGAVFQIGIVPGAGVCIANHRCNGGSTGGALLQPGEKFRRVCLLAGGRVCILSRSAAGQKGAQCRQIYAQSCRNTVQNHANARAVRLAENR